MGVEEHSLPTERQPLIFQMDGVVHRVITKAMDNLLDRIQILWSRRHQWDRGPDPDYASPIDKLENIRDIIREEISELEPSVHIENNPRQTPQRNDSWQNKVLVGVAITVISAVILGAFTTWALVESLRTQMGMYMESNNKRLDQDETRIRDTERRLDRGAP